METEPAFESGDRPMSLDAEQARQHLAEVERAESLIWTNSPPLGWAWPVAFGLWFGAFVAIQSVASTLLSILGLIGLMAVMGAGVRWYVAKRGTMPKGLRTAPAELHRPMIGYLVSVAATAAVAVALHIAVGGVISALFVTVAATIIMAVYERTYATAAAAATRRLDASTGRST